MLVLLVCAIGGGYFFFSRYELISEDGQYIIRRRDGQGSSSESDEFKLNIPQPSIRKRNNNLIQVATFNAGPLDEMKLSSAAIVDHLANTIRNFDVVALQNIQVRDPGKLNLILKRLNSRGRHYEYVVSPGQASIGGAFNAFLFDGASVEVDLDQVFSLNDPKGRFPTRPLSALFRVRGPKKDQAFTFVAINVYVNPAEREAELDFLPDVWDEVKENYPKEDDLLLCASLQASPPNLGAVGNIPGITYAVENRSNLVQGNALTDNILFDRHATIEYVGESGVYDLGRRLRLKPEQTAKVTRHLPVWATFNIYEGKPF